MKEPKRSYGKEIHKLAIEFVDNGTNLHEIIGDIESLKFYLLMKSFEAFNDGIIKLRGKDLE